MNRCSNEKIFYNGKRFSLVQRKYVRNNKEYTRDILLTNPAVVIIPITSDHEVILLRQYREAIESQNLEFPAGIVEEKEEPIEAARRELEEETGFRANQLELLTTVYSSAGITNEKVYIYLATDLKKGNLKLDQDEFIEEVLKIPENQILDLLKNDQLIQSNQKLALFMYIYHKRGNGSHDQK